MPKVGAGNEPLHERLIFAYDGTDYQVVACDTDGNLVAAVLADQNVQARPYGWISGAWQKQAMPFGFSDRVAEVVTDINTGAGADSVQTTPVPAGEYHVITHLEMYALSATCDNLIAYQYAGAVTPPIFGQVNPVSSQIYDRQGWWVLKPGDYIKVYGFTLTAGDDLQVGLSGFRVDVDQ